MRPYLSYLWHLNWYLANPKQIPLRCNLDEYLPLPDLKHVRISWPNKYSWSLGKWRLELIKKELSRLVPITLCDIADKDLDWHKNGGFPIPDEKKPLIGTPRNPKGLYDIRGEIFEVHTGNQIIRCAYDYSDYPVISTRIVDQVDIYFKCITPVDSLPSNVVSVGYFPKNSSLLSKARARTLKGSVKKHFDVYARFGSRTDSQPLRQVIIDNLSKSPLHFVGGFTTYIYPAYLREMMRARIAIDAPGNAPLSYRLVEAMALGILVVSPKPACTFPEEMIDGIHYISMKDDGSDVVEVCHEILGKTEQRETIIEQAMIFFDRNFSPQSMARRILITAFNLAC